MDKFDAIPDFILEVRFYRSESGTEPVRDWLKSLRREDKKTIGEDIKKFFTKEDV